MISSLHLSVLHYLLLFLFCIFNFSFPSVLGPGSWQAHIIRSLREAKTGWKGHGSTTSWVPVEEEEAVGVWRGFSGAWLTATKHV